MKLDRWQIKLGIGLVLASAAMYFVHYLLFDDAHHIFIYLVGDIAFAPIKVLIVTLILHRLLEVHEKRHLLEKLNMVIGAFFNEVGTDLLHRLFAFDRDADTARAELATVADWSAGDFAREAGKFKTFAFDVDSRQGDLADLQQFVRGKREFVLRLLENPNLLEHETFTELLWAVTHLTEELVHRADVAQSPDSDLNHLSGDIKRVYGLLIYEWLQYMKHLKESYPYLFSLAVRINPFKDSADAVVT